MNLPPSLQDRRVQYAIVAVGVIALLVVLFMFVLRGNTSGQSEIAGGGFPTAPGMPGSMDPSAPGYPGPPGGFPGAAGGGGMPPGTPGGPPVAGPPGGFGEYGAAPGA